MTALRVLNSMRRRAALAWSLTALLAFEVDRARAQDGHDSGARVDEQEDGVDLGSLDPDVEDQLDDDSESIFAGESELGAGSGIRVETTCTNCNAASLTVNGLSSDHVEVSWDGIPAAGGLAAVYYLTQFPADFLGHAKVVRGPGSVLTGAHGVGGAIELHSVKRDERRGAIRLELGDWGWRELSVAATESWGPVGALFFVQGATQDTVDANDDSYNEVADFERFTQHGIFDFQLTDAQVLTLAASFYGEDQLDGPGGAAADPRSPNRYFDEDAFFNWRQFSLSWKLERPSGLGLTFDARYSRRGQQQWSPPLDRVPELPKRRSYWIEEELSHGRVTLARPVGSAGFLTAGGGWNKQRLHVLQVPDGLQPEWIVDGLEQLELFAQYDRSSGARWHWSLGLRWDEFTVFGRSIATGLFGDVTRSELDDLVRSHVSPRGQVTFQASDEVVLSVAAGRGILGPKPAFEETCCGAKYQRNVELPPERAWSYQARVEWRPRRSVRLTTTLFRNDIDDYHERIVHSVQGAVPRYATAAIPDVRIRGLDVAHEMRFADDRVTVGWTYTYTDADGGTYDRPCRFGLEHPDGELTPLGSGVRHVPEHAASAYVRYDDARRGTKVGFDARHQGSVSHFLVGSTNEDGDFDPNRLECQPWEYLDSEAYWSLGLSFEQRVGRGGWSVHGGVDNVLDYVMPDLGEYESSYDWGPITGRFVYGGVKFEY